MVFPSDLVFFLALEVTVLVGLLTLVTRLIPPRWGGWGIKALWLGFFAKLAFPFGFAPLGQIYPTAAGVSSGAGGLGGPTLLVPSGSAGIHLGPAPLGPVPEAPFVSFADEPFAIIAAIGIGLLILLAVRMVLAGIQVAQLSPIDCPALGSRTDRLARELGLGGRVRFRELAPGRSPASWGIFRQVILLPRDWATALGDDDLEQILLHELVHLKSHDSWLCLATQALSCLYWFHPLVWMAHRQFQGAVEAACDQKVLALRGGKNRTAYGAALLKTMENTLAVGLVPGTRAAARGKRALRRRIVMIKNYRPTPRRGLGLVAIVLGALFLVSLSLVPAVAMGSAEPSKPIQDNINLPFVDDPSVLGTWTSVDFVATPDSFVPDKKLYADPLYVTGITFFSNGQFRADVAVDNSSPGPNPTQAWTKGTVINKENVTASAYTMKKVGDQTFLFWEWKSGDYTFRGHKPKYYVFLKS